MSARKAPPALASLRWRVTCGGTAVVCGAEAVADAAVRLGMVRSVADVHLRRGQVFEIAMWLEAKGVACELVT